VEKVVVMVAIDACNIFFLSRYLTFERNREVSKLESSGVFVVLNTLGRSPGMHSSNIKVIVNNLIFQRYKNIFIFII